MRLLILLFCGVFIFGPDAAPAIPSQQKAANQYGLGLGTIGRTVEGARFCRIHRVSNSLRTCGPLCGRLSKIGMTRFQHLGREKEKLAIEFAITKDGKVVEMQLVSTPGGPDDEALVRSLDQHHKVEPFPSTPKRIYGIVSRSALSLRLQPKVIETTRSESPRKQRQE